MLRRYLSLICGKKSQTLQAASPIGRCVQDEQVVDTLCIENTAAAVVRRFRPSTSSRLHQTMCNGNEDFGMPVALDNLVLRPLFPTAACAIVSSLLSS